MARRGSDKYKYILFRHPDTEALPPASRLAPGGLPFTGIRPGEGVDASRNRGSREAGLLSRVIVALGGEASGNRMRCVLYSVCESRNPSLTHSYRRRCLRRIHHRYNRDPSGSQGDEYHAGTNHCN